ncbi:MAG: hypothetical protein LUE19_01610 [Clostridiales bacterium]|nr:hypothetical protein [Clostridiales bacterium]
MYGRGRLIRNILFAVIAILLAGGLAFMIYSDEQAQKEQAEAVREIQAEARSYEVELNDLRSELSSLEKSTSYTSDRAEIMVGFIASDVSDMEYISDKAQAYGFPPVLVIDCTMDISDIEVIVEAADENWEIMLYASPFSDESNENVLSVLSYLESAGRDETGVFFLRNSDNSSPNIQMLVDDGFIGYTNYHSESPAAGQTEDGYVYFDYSLIQSTGTAVEDRLSVLYSNKTSMIVIFDMGSIDSGTITETYVTEFMEELQDYAEDDACSFATVEEVVRELSEINMTEAELQAEYEEQAAEIQERIDELEEIISDIYSRIEY